jgi:hypothetical protein
VEEEGKGCGFPVDNWVVYPQWPDTSSVADIIFNSRRSTEEGIVGDKSPKKSNSKKPGKTLKEKRADKNAKREEKRPGFGS